MAPSQRGLRGLIEGVKEEIKVIMYISNPQHFERAKRQNCLQPQRLDMKMGASVAVRVSHRHGNRLFRIIICHMCLVTIRSWL